MCVAMIMIARSFLFFFFSSRRRHTRCSRDWSSDVCSSDLGGQNLVRGLNNLLSDIEKGGGQLRISMTDENAFQLGKNVRSEERRVGKSVDLGGRRIIKKKKNKKMREESRRK